MTKKIFYLEDIEDEFEHYKNIFDGYSKTYDVSFYPSSLEEFSEFSSLLRRYAIKKDSDCLLKIKAHIQNINPDFILVDIALDGKPSNSKDRSGIEIKEKVIDQYFPDVPVTYLSLFASNIVNQQDYIIKDPLTIKTDLLLNVIEKLNPDLNPVFSNEKNNKQYQHSHIRKVPKTLEKLANREKFWLRNWIAFISDKVVTYVFYFLSIILFLFAPIFIVNNSLHSFDIIHISENIFLAFLPFLILCSFFVFYIKSLRPYILDIQIDKDDFESSSRLMTLTKKLFITSLLSYLFIKIIELLYFEKRPTNKDDYFLIYYNTSNPFMRFYIIGALILILIVCYILISKKTSNN